VRRFLAVDDCGTVINPMIVEGQIHGGLTEGFAMAFIQEIQYDAEGNNLNTNSPTTSCRPRSRRRTGRRRIR
jgi:carbon-monoxide dehydrogenase large subunit